MSEQWQDHLEWGLSWSIWARLLVLTLAAAVVVLTWVNVRQASSWRRRAALIGLRLLTMVSLLVVWLQPIWVSVVPKSGASRVAVVVDRSASMAVGKAGDRRWDRALKAAEKLAASGGAELYSMGAGLEPARTMDELRTRTPDAPVTDLATAVWRLGELHRATRLRGAVVISDGLDNAGLRARNPVGAATLDPDTASELRGLHAPVHAVHIEDPEPVRDIAVAAVRVSSFGYTRTFVPVAVDLEISAMAKSTGSLTLELSDNGKVMVSQQVSLAGPVRRTVDMEFQPLHVGTHVLAAHAVALPEEATDANNRAWVGMRVIRDRTRVLHLAGHPSWDTRFLRTHLHGDAAVDLVSFYVMVGQGAGSFVSSEDTTLIPFPAKEIFEESLSGFDLVILQDFPFGPFQLEQYLPQLTQYLRGGGALLVLGGPECLGAGGYAGTGLAELLPVQLGTLGEDGGWSWSAQRLALTPVGAIHPASLLGKAAEDNTQIWGAHRFTGRNTGLQVRPGSHVLVTGVGGEPLLAVGDIGEGRSAVLATDSLWTWAFSGDSADSDTTRELQRGHYHRLLDALSAWLLRDPDLDLLRIESPAEPVLAGAAFSVRVSLRDGAGQPKAGVQIRWGVKAITEGAGEVAADRRWDRPTDPRGHAEIAAPGMAAGAWLFVAEAEIDGRKHRATGPVVVAAVTAESTQLQPSDRLLALLARSSGGVVFGGGPPAAGLPEPAPQPGEQMALADKVHADLWSQPGVLIWLVGLLVGEWFLRRRWGLA